jgi:hypothetical protein
VVAEYRGGNVSGTPGVFRITRKVTGVSNPVTNTFTYSIAATSGNPGTATGYPTSATIAMNNTAVSSRVATATTDLDFTSTTFSELGDYYFTVSETASTDVTNYPLDSHSYRVVASVRNELNASSNTPTGKYIVTIAANSVDADDNKADAAGANAFTSEAARTYIEIHQKVEGNMAKADDCFTYTISIPAVAGKAAAGDTYPVVNNSSCTGSSANVTVGSSNNKIVLKMSDSATIGKRESQAGSDYIPVGLEYTISIDDSKGYTTYFDQVQANSVSKTTALYDNGAIHTTILSTNNADPNTGILMNLWPFVALILLAGVGTVIVVNKSKKNAE